MRRHFLKMRGSLVSSRLFLSGSAPTPLISSRQTGERHIIPELYRIRGNLLVHSKKDDPEADYLKALELARQQGTRLFELRAAMSLAQLWADQHKCAEAHDLLVPIYEWFTEGFSTPISER
jgi:predicted ATPase